MSEKKSPALKIVSVILALILAWFGYDRVGGEKNGKPTDEAAGHSSTTHKADPGPTKAKTKAKTKADTASAASGRSKPSTSSAKSTAKSPHPRAISADEARTSAGEIENLYLKKRSKVVVETAGTVVHILRDDNYGSRHQLFLVELPNRHTIKISHNIDLAPRVPVKKGDRIEVRGQFEHNDKGGVVHWTHGDPGGRRPGGWIRHRGEVYR